MPARLHLHLYDGARNELALMGKPFIAWRQQFELPNEGKSRFVNANKIVLDLEVTDKGGYAIYVALKGHEDVGLAPVPVHEGQDDVIPLMLVAREPSYQFTDAHWNRLPPRSRVRRLLLGLEIGRTQEVGDRYMALMDRNPDAVACFLNIVAALALVPLQALPGLADALDYLVALDWQNVRRDRFFAYARPELEKALTAGFEPSALPGAFHPGAVASFKQTAFHEANLQFTFHGESVASAKHGRLVRVELDMDYYHDLLSHTLLEVIPNSLSFGRRKTDPRRIYVMRWIAGRTASPAQEFAPLFTLG